MKKFYRLRLRSVTLFKKRDELREQAEPSVRPERIGRVSSTSPFRLTAARAAPNLRKGRVKPRLREIKIKHLCHLLFGFASRAGAGHAMALEML